MQGKVDKLSDALRASQKQAKQADAEAQEMEKAFRVLQIEASAAINAVCGRTVHAQASCYPAGDNPLQGLLHPFVQCW